MTANRKQSLCPRDPIGLSRDEAAAFIGVSENTFQKAVDNGLMPEPFELFGRKLWYAAEIETSLKRLPRRAPKAQSPETDDIWAPRPQ
jgi:hypothetical protein